MRINTRDAIETNMTQQETNRRKLTEKNVSSEGSTCTKCLSTMTLDVPQRFPLPNKKYVVASRVVFPSARRDGVHPHSVVTGTTEDIAEGAPRSLEHDFAGSDVEANAPLVANDILFGSSRLRTVFY